ncbi:hypothetical protein CEXT_51311 [Caerostris extrusa]|uniref:Uncharacterized protein n=1 Tax=Caerostris extrusa TaxID=172846 RepID=A0AAV4MN42_CAEEX|nr:hypothetical protein CEXT_51311 [Caerostris extrusa]
MFSRNSSSAQGKKVLSTKWVEKQQQQNIYPYLIIVNSLHHVKMFSRNSSSAQGKKVLSTKWVQKQQQQNIYPYLIIVNSLHHVKMFSRNSSSAQGKRCCLPSGLRNNNNKIFIRT